MKMTGMMIEMLIYVVVASTSAAIYHFFGYGGLMAMIGGFTYLLVRYMRGVMALKEKRARRAE